VAAEGKISARDIDLMLVTDDPAECVQHIQAARAYRAEARRGG
jgi:hypothetical protein